jgi:histidinol-phosphate aminotransferase
MTIPNFTALANVGVQGLKAYDAGHDIVKLRQQFSNALLVELGSNENTYGPSPRAREAVLNCLNELHRYPDPLGSDLKNALALKYDVAPNQIMLGNGSHELLMMIAQVFAGPGQEVLISQYGFAVYALAAQAAGAKLVLAPALKSDVAQSRGHDLDAIAGLANAQTRIIYLANPNNPTGTWFSNAVFENFMQKISPNTLVVVDEAYIEYADAAELRSVTNLLSQYPNLMVTRTFSKAYALAGLRVGYVFAHVQAIAVMERIRESFNVNLPALAACIAALNDEPHLQWLQKKNREERDWLISQISAFGLSVANSQTNFVLVDFKLDASEIENYCVQNGLVLRPMRGYGLSNCLRITVGNRDENRCCIEVLSKALSKVSQ